jgi:hypothetical protein
VRRRRAPRKAAGHDYPDRAPHSPWPQPVANLSWAAGYNIVAIPLAAGVLAWAGILLATAVGAVLMSASTVIVAINAQLLRRTELQGSSGKRVRSLGGDRRFGARGRLRHPAGSVQGADASGRLRAGRPSRWRAAGS